MHIRQTQHGARERPEAAGVGYRDRQRATLDACHWRLYDRFLYAQKVLKRSHEESLLQHYRSQDGYAHRGKILLP
jgi:hypothetical protein